MGKGQDLDGLFVVCQRTKGLEGLCGIKSDSIVMLREVKYATEGLDTYLPSQPPRAQKRLPSWMATDELPGCFVLTGSIADEGLLTRY